VSGKGSFTDVCQQLNDVESETKGSHTDNVSAEESIDPTHDQTLRHHHSHVAFHHAHHALHHRRIAHGVRLRLVLRIRVSQEPAILGAIEESFLAALESSFGNLLVVVAQVLGAAERALFADFG
jgi:hypothetical protein